MTTQLVRPPSPGPPVAADLSTQDLAHALVEATTALVSVVDREGRIVLANAAMQRFTGCSAAELTGRSFLDVYVIPSDVDAAASAFAAALAGGEAAPEEGDWISGTGEWRRVAMHNCVLLDDAGVPYALACVGVDVTEERQVNALMHVRATTDALTGAQNRRALFDALEEHLDPDTGRGCGVLFCDVDDFKLVNDEQGHAAGDRLLAEVAARLRELAGPGDLVARFGGDEFVLLCAGIDHAGLAARARAARERMRAPLETPAGVVRVRLSIGSSVGRPGEDADELVARADRAMYRMKSRRRARGTDH